MKITRIETLEIDLSGQCGLPSWWPVFARVDTDEGITGLGEVGLAYGTGAPAAAPMIRVLGERFIPGKDPNDTETIWEQLLRRSFWAQGGGPVVFGAMSAIDAALWDIKGKAAGLPVHRLLGAETPKPLRCHASQMHIGWEDTNGLKNDPSEYRETAQSARAGLRLRQGLSSLCGAGRPTRAEARHLHACGTQARPRAHGGNPRGCRTRFGYHPRTEFVDLDCGRSST